MFILDSHCDTPSQLYRLRDFTQDGAHSHVDLPKLLRSGVDASFFALFIPSRLNTEDAYTYALALLEATKKNVLSNSNMLRLSTSVEEAVENKEHKLKSIFLGLENASPLGTDERRLDFFYKEGIRYITLCHSADNLVCDSCTGNETHGGLSTFGKRLVERMNDAGMLIDCAHISDKSFWDLVRYSKKSFVSTHSCCRSICDHPRNMTDDMIRALSERGGVIQINFYPKFIDRQFTDIYEKSKLKELEYIEDEFIKDPSDGEKRNAWFNLMDRMSKLERPSYKKVVDHIEHVIDLVGINHVGIGSDFDGISVTPTGLEDISKIGVVFEEMRRRGYSNQEISKVAGENFLRVLSEQQVK